MPKERKKKCKEFPCKCFVKHCRRIVKKRDKSNKCSKHRAAAWKEKHPLKYHFNKLRNRARERGHAFTLSFEKYESICLYAGWVTENRGKTGKAYSIDRKRDGEGYHDDNVQVLTLSENCRKRYVDRLNGLSDSDKADTDDEAGECEQMNFQEGGEPPF
jgi:hypothetical protein